MAKVYVSRWCLNDWAEEHEFDWDDVAEPAYTRIVLATTDDAQADPAMLALIEAQKQQVLHCLDEDYKQDAVYVEQEKVFRAEHPDRDYLDTIHEATHQAPRPIWAESWSDARTRVVLTLRNTPEPGESAPIEAEGEYEGLGDQDRFAHDEDLATITIVVDDIG